jgi:hypothetical protein
MRSKRSYFLKQLEAQSFPTRAGSGQISQRFYTGLIRSWPESPRKLSGPQRSKPAGITDPAYSSAKTEQLP